MHELRGSLYKQYLSEATRSLSTKSVGDRLSRLGNDASILGFFLGNTVPTVVPQILTGLGALAFLLFNHWIIGIGLLVVAFVLGVASIIIGNRLRKSAAKAMRQNANLLEFSEESLNARDIAQAFVAESWFEKQYGELSADSRKLNIQYSKIRHSMGPFTRGLGTIMVIVGIGLLLTSPSWSNSSVADLASPLVYAFLALRPLSSLSSTYGAYQQASAAHARLTEQLSKHSPTYPSDNTDTLVPAGGAALKIVDLTYRTDNGKLLIDGLNLSIKANEIIAILGENGAGKSTFCELLMQLIPAERGSLSINGISASQMSTAYWRRHFGYQPQQVNLLQGSLANNISLGRKVSKNDWEQLLRTSDLEQLHIKTAEDLANDQLGLNGNGLSGGQKLRVAHARSVLKRPPILLFDEPTSMLDDEGVERFVGRLDELRKHSTVLLITHDVRITGYADRSISLNIT